MEGYSNVVYSGAQTERVNGETARKRKKREEKTERDGQGVIELSARAVPAA